MMSMAILFYPLKEYLHFQRPLLMLTALFLYAGTKSAILHHFPKGPYFPALWVNVKINH